MNQRHSKKRQRLQNESNLNTQIGKTLRERFKAAGLKGCPEPKAGRVWSPLGYAPSTELIWPDFCGSGEAMSILMDAMCQLGWVFRIAREENGMFEVSATSIWMSRTSPAVKASTLPLAVAKAAAISLDVSE